MAGEARESRPEERPGVANLGPLRPPLVYLGALLLGVLLELVLPLPLLRPAVGTPLGAGIVLLAVGLFVASVRTFRAAGTPIPGNRPTTTIVSSGPYRLSRNPIYLAFSLLLVGMALWVDTPWLLVTLAVAIGLMNFVVIPREERYLAARFPAEYQPYRTAVRRWL